MSLAVYIHIPYCLQRCRYCDFTTFEFSQIMPPEKYVNLLCQEIRNRYQAAPSAHIRTLYFGGGTPSLLPAELIVSVIKELANVGFIWSRESEITLEINPATVSPQKMELYLGAGINRFSVGAQTFSDSMLQSCGRRHSAQETRQTLDLLASHQVNYSFDLLFALPGQSLEDVQKDLDEVIDYSPPHLSAYCLTVPESHPMAYGRPPEDEQIEMFHLIERQLSLAGLKKYEISNFAKPGFESQHNLSYWQDRPYWGLGLSAHSYFLTPPFGIRFWNPKSLELYEKQTLKWSFLPEDQQERLTLHEALTDFCHMHLRTMVGLNLADVTKKFGGSVALRVQAKLRELVKDSWLQVDKDVFSLTSEGQLLSNQVFAHLCWTKDEIPKTQENGD